MNNIQQHKETFKEKFGLFKDKARHYTAEALKSSANAADYIAAKARKGSENLK